MEPQQTFSELFKSGLFFTALAVGIPAVVAIVIHGSRRRLRRERPPVKTSLLRPAGYSLNKRADELWDRLENQYAICVVVFVAFAAVVPVGWKILVWMSADHVSIVELRQTGHTILCLVSLASLPGLPIFGLWVTRHFTSKLTELVHYRFGAKGELAVAQALQSRAICGAGYESFHDLPMDYGNIDHVCVGPGGIYVIETKTRSKRKSRNEQAEHEVVFDGRTLRFPWGEDHKAVKQVLANAEWLRRQLAGFTPKELLIKPVIVVPGWYLQTHWQIPCRGL